MSSFSQPSSNQIQCYSYSGLIYAVLSAVLMATIGVFSKLSGLSADGVTFYRLFLGAFFMLFFLIVQGKTRLLRQRPPPSVIINGCFLAGFIVFYVQAMNFTTMANAIMLVYLAPLLAAVMAHYFLDEKAPLSTFALILLALLGFSMMLEFKLDYGTSGEALKGLFFACLAMVCYCGFILMNRKIKIDVHNSTFYQLLIGAIAVSPFYFWHFSPLEPWQMLLMLGVGLLPGFLAIYFAVVALRRLEAATFGTLAYFEPLTVVLFGWFIFDEYLTPLQLGGCIIILFCGIFKSLLEKRKMGAP